MVHTGNLGLDAVQFPTEARMTLSTQQRMAISYQYFNAFVGPERQLLTFQAWAA